MSKQVINKREVALGYLGLLFLVAGTIRAVQLEADNQKIVYIVGALATLYALNAVWNLRK